MAGLARNRLETRVQRFDPPSWSEPAPAQEPVPFSALVFGFATALCLVWWATAPEVLVASARRDGGRVLACQYLAGTRVVERQYLGPASGVDEQSCRLVRFG